MAEHSKANMLGVLGSTGDGATVDVAATSNTLSLTLPAIEYSGVGQHAHYRAVFMHQVAGGGDWRRFVNRLTF